MPRVRPISRLRAGRAAVDSSGSVKVTGVGAAVSESAQVSGAGFRVTASRGAGALQAQASAVAGTGLPDGTNNKARANSYDSAWLSSWVANAQTILAGNSGQHEGMIIHVGDSLTRTAELGAWSIARTGATAEDVAILDWMHAGTSSEDIQTTDGYYLQAPDKTTFTGYPVGATRSYTSAGSRGAWDFMGTAMPTVDIETTVRKQNAQVTLDDFSTYPGDLNLRTILNAIKKPQFAIITVNLAESYLPGGANYDAGATHPGLHPDFIAMHDTLEAEGILPIVCTYTYRFVAGNHAQGTAFNDSVTAYNAALKAFAQARAYPLIDFDAEMQGRIPITNTTSEEIQAKWNGRLLSGDGVHYTQGTQGGYTGSSDPYADGGDAATHTTGAMMTYQGYALKGWLIAQKLKQIKALVVDPLHVASPLNLPLYDPAKINYLGYFRVSGDRTGNGQPLIEGRTHNGFSFQNQAVGGMAFNPNGNGGQGSLLLTGSSLNNDGRNTVMAEVEIPTDLSGTARAARTTQFVLSCDTINKFEEAYTESGVPVADGVHLTGLVIDGGKIYMTAAGRYSSQFISYCMFIRSTDDLDDNSATVSGPYGFSFVENNRWTGMGLGGGPIPAEFQSVLQGTQFGGGTGAASIGSNMSFGPTVLSWTPSDYDGKARLDGIEPNKLSFWKGLGRSNEWSDPVPADTAFSPFPQNTRAQFGDQTQAPHWFPFSEYNHSDMNRQSFMVPGYRTIFCFGRHANSAYDTFGNEQGVGQGLISDQEYRSERFWMYDARDCAANISNPVNNGPFFYDVHDMNFSLRDQAGGPSLAQKRTCAFDPTTRRLYVHVEGDEGSAPNPSFSGSLPLIHVLEFPD